MLYFQEGCKVSVNAIADQSIEEAARVYNRYDQAERSYSKYIGIQNTLYRKKTTVKNVSSRNARAQNKASTKYKLFYNCYEKAEELLATLSPSDEKEQLKNYMYRSNMNKKQQLYSDILEYYSNITFKKSKSFLVDGSIDGSYVRFSEDSHSIVYSGDISSTNKVLKSIYDEGHKQVLEIMREKCIYR